MIINTYVETPFKNVSVVRFNTEDPVVTLRLIHSNNVLAGGILQEHSNVKIYKIINDKLDTPELLRFFSILRSRYPDTRVDHIKHENFINWMKILLTELVD